MIENLEKFEALQVRIQAATQQLAHLDQEPFPSIRTQLSVIDGAVGRYTDVNYPIPFRRPDDPVLDIVQAAAALADLVVGFTSASEDHGQEHA